MKHKQSNTIHNDDISTSAFWIEIKELVSNNDTIVIKRVLNLDLDILTVTL